MLKFLGNSTMNNSNKVERNKQHFKWRNKLDGQRSVECTCIKLVNHIGEVDDSLLCFLRNDARSQLGMMRIYH